MSSPQRTKAGVVAEFRRGQILDAARERFVRRGVAETTVDHIARAAHVAKGTVYLYYRSKDEILRQVLESDLTELRDVTLPAIREPGTIDARLERYVRATLEFFERKRDFIDHCQLELSPEVRKKVRTALGHIYHAQVDAWREVLAAAVSEHAVSVADAGRAAGVIVSVARGLAMQRLAGWSEDTIDAAAARASRLLWKGLATR
jgi:TetR/AcrR family fatty acid metabolism transcriptional regulator